MRCSRCGLEVREGLLTCPHCDATPIAERPAPAAGELVTVRSGLDTAAMLVAISRLDEAGIPYFVKGEIVQDLFGAGRMGLGFSAATGPPELQVIRDDEARARGVLEPRPDAVPSEAELAELARSAGSPDEEAQPPLEGLGGLLTVLGVLVFAYPLWMGSWLSDLVTGWNSKVWRDAVTPGGSDYHPLWAPLRAGQLAVDSLLLAWSGLLVLLFWHRKRWFPVAMSAFLVANLIAEGLILLALWHIPSYAELMDARYLRDLVVLAGLALVWVPYLRLSERVRNTFVE